MSLHLLLYYQNTGILYILGRGKGGIRTEELGMEELDAQHYALCTLNYMYICILLLVIMNC